MRTVIISPTEKWLIPDVDTSVHLYDLFLQHEKESATDGAIDSITISGKIYKAPFYNGIAKFYLDENEKLEATKEPKKLSVTLNGTIYDFYLWNGILRTDVILPAVIFSTGEDSVYSFIPNLKYFCFAENDENIIYIDLENRETFSFETEIYNSKKLYVWFSNSIPENIHPDAKLYELKETCIDDLAVSFLLLNGEMRTYFLHEKRQVATFSETENKNIKLKSLVTGNEKTYQISDGQNKVSRILYIEDLTSEQLDEINQLSVSRYVEINGVRTNIVRNSATIKGNEKGMHSFFIEVENII